MFALLTMSQITYHCKPHTGECMTRWCSSYPGLLAELVLSLQGRMYTLPDVWIRPNFGGKGRKVTGQLEAHTNGFRYSSPKGESLDIMYRCTSASLRPLLGAF